MKKWEGEVGRIRERTSEGDSGVDSGGTGAGAGQGVDLVG